MNEKCPTKFQPGKLFKCNYRDALVFVIEELPKHRKESYSRAYKTYTTIYKYKVLTDKGFIGETYLMECDWDEIE